MNDYRTLIAHTMTLTESVPLRDTRVGGYAVLDQSCVATQLLLASSYELAVSDCGEEEDARVGQLGE